MEATTAAFLAELYRVVVLLAGCQFTICIAGYLVDTASLNGPRTGSAVFVSLGDCEMTSGSRRLRAFMTRSDTEAGADVSIPSLGRDVTLVGRDETLEVLETEAAEVASGSFRVVLITGGAGVGKTRIVAEAMSRFGGEAVRMSARSYRWGGITSFGPWVEALDRHLRGCSHDEIRRLAGPSLHDLVAILASVAPIAGATNPEPSRGRLLDALAHLFTSLSNENPVLLAFDDLHLADASAWEALRYLARRLSVAPIGIFATARPAQLAAKPISREVLLGLDDDRLLTRIDLAPLTRRHVATLAHEVLRQEPSVPSAFVPEPLVDWLMERSLGHPLFVIGLLRAVAEEGADLTAPRLERIPQKISERLVLDLQTLDQGYREILEVLAVVDQRFDVEGLQRLTERSAKEISMALEALSNTRLVAEHGTTSDLRYEIAHPIVQEVIYEEIGSARKSLLHSRIAHLMLESDRLGAAASHFARAGTRDDEEAVDALFRAMEQASKRDLYQEALAVLEALLEVLPSGDPRWVRVLDSITLHSEWVLSHLAETDAGTAIEAIRRVIDVLEDSSDTRARALALFHIAAFLSFGEARFDEAEQACQEAVELFRGSGDLAGELLATNELAWFHGCRGDFAGNADLAQQVLTRARGRILTHVATVAAGTSGFASGIIGRFDEARRYFELALDLAEEADIGYRVAWSHAQGSHYLALGGYLDEAITFGEMALDDHPAAPDAMAFEDLAVAYWLQGRLEDAGNLLDRSAVRRPILGSRRRAWGSALAARIYMEMGQRSRAYSSLERATSTYDDRFFIWSSWKDWSEGLVAWIDGCGSKALSDLKGLADWLEATGASGYLPLVLDDLSQVAVDNGDVVSCERAAVGSSEVAVRNSGPLAGWLAPLAAARFHLIIGDPASAIEEATEAVASLDDAGYKVLAASGQQVLGEALSVRDRAAAVETLEHAAREFTTCGAVWRRDRCLAILGDLGTRGRRAAASIHGPASLTSREREIASLTAQGHTAHGVGRKLFIGKRTVETHLANIYAKLGITSKRELIQHAEEFGL